MPPPGLPSGARVPSPRAGAGAVSSTRAVRNRFRPLGAAPPPPSSDQACTHPVQVAGLCAVCGQELDPASLGQTSIAMAHSSAGIKVSRSEAKRLDTEATQQLLAGRRLALIIDLDQTVIHATVDPTVGDWLSDPSNPNYPALEGVGRFKLAADGHTILRVEPYSVLAERARRGRDEDESEDEWDEGPEGCWYYVKQRKGLQAFLKKMSTKYELHVYTMGTRSYADCVCQLVDPTGTLFGARILSRDENGSMLQKSLSRLFPMDTSMVVVIDDRADVWKWSPNLVKVIPYEFFVGIGDINASFLPPVTGSDTQDDDATDEEPGESRPATEEPQTEPAPVADSEQGEPEKAVQAALAAQVDDRPLAKMQQALETDRPAEHEQTHQTASLSQMETTPSTTTREGDAVNLGLGLVEQEDLQEEQDAEAEIESDAETSFRPRVLRDNDEELPRVAEVLGSIHANWYAQWDATRHLPNGEEPVKPRVEEIIARLKARALAGCTIVFSGVFPLDTDPYSQPLVRAAQEFGAQVQAEVTPLVTHLVAARSGTEKSRLAQKAGVAHIVYLDWLHNSIAHWTHLPESAYALPLPEEDRSRLGTPAPEGNDPLSISHMDWGVAADEIDAFLEDDDDDEDEDEYEEDQSRASSVAPGTNPDTSYSGIGERQGSTSPKRRFTPDPDAEPLSPLSKRRKLAEARKGQSKLKHAVTMDEAEAAAEVEESEEPEEGEGQGEGEGESGPEGRRGRSPLLAPKIVRRLSTSSVRPSRAPSEAGDSVDLDAFADDLELELEHDM